MQQPLRNQVSASLVLLQSKRTWATEENWKARIGGEQKLASQAAGQVENSPRVSGKQQKPDLSIRKL